MTRILLYTGKGGVGKTSIAAATALLCAKRGLKTIVLSTDIAHSLADAFDVPLGAEPTQITENLWGQEPDVYFNIGRYWRTIQTYMTELFSWRGLDAVMAEEMTVLPGMDELGNLLWIADHVESGLYDVIVVDAAPTGETLRLLSLPEASRWWIERIAPIGRRVSRIGRPMLERMIGVPIPRDEVFAAAERLLIRLDKVHRLLADPETSTVRIVLALEKLSIVEAQRSFTYFHLFGYPSDLVVCNRVLPADKGGAGSFASLRQTQQRYLPQVEAQFAPVPVRTVPQFDREMIGVGPLTEIGDALFGESDPADFLYRGRPYTVRSEADGRHILEVALPFTSRDELQLSRNGDEMLIQIGGLRRSIVLPRALVDSPTRGAKMDDGILRVEFEARERDGARSATGGKRQ
ncbi:MAG TPA: TRC40/GET3/ArsA family transport-energizing ATPase [Candidatus Limnocylindrales bacterium]|nr:TRC40/GET3/ArsA family transport-energizing ATPase [Candidatus Limnocylindrales bacterium]